MNRQYQGKSNIQGRILFDLARRHGVKDRCNLPDIVLLTKISNDVAPGAVTSTLSPVFEITTDIIGRPGEILEFLFFAREAFSISTRESLFLFRTNRP